MERQYIADAIKLLNEKVYLRGFIDNLRDSKYMTFIVLKDISGKIQVTIEKETHPEMVM